MNLRLAALLGLLLVAAGPRVFAHQLDEYLQTTFISLGKDAVRVEMFLTRAWRSCPPCWRRSTPTVTE
jgi:hypothetical protein